MAIETGQSGQELSAVTWDDSDLDEDYFEDEAELPGRPLRKRLGPMSIGLLAFAFAAIAFFSGVLVEKHNVGTSSSTSNLTSLINQFRGAAGAAGGTGTGARTGTGAAATGTGAAGGGAGAFGGAGGATRGTITLIDGSNIYVTLSGGSGSIVKVQTNPATTYSITSAGTITQLHPGDTVSVTGPTDSSGNQTATAVTDGGAGGAGGVVVRSGTARTGAAAGGAAAGGAATPAAPGG